MPYNNIKALLLDATKYPVAIEAKLPAGAPKVSDMLINAANQFPVVPDFPFALPDLPAPPTLPTPPPLPAAGLRTYVTGVQVTPVPIAAAATLRTSGTRVVFE